MKKLKSSLVNMVIVLTLIAIVAGGLLAYVNNETKLIIEGNKDEKLHEGLKEVMGGGEIKIAKEEECNGMTVYTLADGSDQTIGKAIETTSNGFGGPLKVLVGFDDEGTILGYTILEHAETPGLGAKADKWFQKDGKGNIIGKNPGKCNFTVSKDGGEIDAITASTITSRAFLLAVQNAYDEIYGKNENQASAKE